MLADGGLRPEIVATVDGDVLTVTSVPPADAANLWTAVNPTERDFRQQTIGDSWTSSYLDDRGGGNYAATLSPPATGYGAYFVELEFVNRWEVPQTYTTRGRSARRASARPSTVWTRLDSG